MNDHLRHVSSSELPCERLGWVDDWRDELEDDISCSNFFDGKCWGLQVHPDIKVHLSPLLKQGPTIARRRCALS